MPKYRPNLIAGHPAIDFVNTVGNRFTESPVEHLNDYDDLLSWCESTQIIDHRSIRKLRASSRRHISQSRASLQRAVVAREQLYRILESFLVGKVLKESDLAVLNVYLQEIAGRLRIDTEERGNALEVSGTHFDLPLDRVLWRFIGLATSLRLHSLKQCAGLGCGWFFLDESRNRSRKWCDSADCGNRERVRRFYYSNRQPHK